MHQQFAENMNDINNRFITLFIGIISLFGFYGFTYAIAAKYITNKDWSITNNAVFSLAIIVSIVLTFLISMLIYQGYQHRRDQYLNTKIRKKYVDTFEYFFSNYTGENKKWHNYLPDYVRIQVRFLFVLKIVLLISLFMLPCKTKASTIFRSQSDTCACPKPPDKTKIINITKKDCTIIVNNNYPVINVNNNSNNTISDKADADLQTSNDTCYFRLISIFLIVMCVSVSILVHCYYYRKYKKLNKK